MNRVEARPVAWALLIIPALVQLILHLATSGNFGIFRDEYYYLACAARPAWGYVDQPPLSIWILSAWTGLFGDSVHSIRILPALCGAAHIVLAGAVAAQMGGGRWAQLLAALAVGVGGVALVNTGFYSMNAFDLLFWLGAYYILIKILRTGEGRHWIAFGVVVGLGLLNKVGLLVLGASLVVGLAVTRHRVHFKDKRLYLAGVIAAAYLLPYLLWNAAHDWATLEFIENAKSGKITAFTPVEYVLETLLEANPLTVVVWTAGLGWLFLARSARPFLPVAVMVIATFVILNLQRSKPYYFASSMPVLMAAGAVAWERWTRGRKLVWVRWLLLVHLVVAGVVLAPMAVPLLSPEETLVHGRRLGIVPKPQEVGHTSPLPQYFSDRFGWEELARRVSEVYQGLPQADRERCIVLGQNYGHAGALEYWADGFSLPPAYTTHNNYWLWGPPAAERDVVIFLDGRRDRLEELFFEVEEMAPATAPHALESPIGIWVCRGWRRPVGDLWAEFKSFG